MQNKKRCEWVNLTKPDYLEYHDVEWGVPVFEDKKMFEFLTLESAQAGLSWYTILRKRENYREAFDGFHPAKIAEYDDKKIEELMMNEGIIRNRMKINAAVNNAKRFLDVQREFGTFSKYIWGFVGKKPIVNDIEKISDIPVTSAVSDALSNDLKKRGFKFLGSTICYAHLQATGLINDHCNDCFRKKEVMKEFRNKSGLID